MKVAEGQRNKRMLTYSVCYGTATCAVTWMEPPSVHLEQAGRRSITALFKLVPSLPAFVGKVSG
jgi:hypothetical protein